MTSDPIELLSCAAYEVLNATAEFLGQATAKDLQKKLQIRCLATLGQICAELTEAGLLDGFPGNDHNLTCDSVVKLNATAFTLVSVRAAEPYANLAILSFLIEPEAPSPDPETTW